jgi:hypothetical protein
MGTWTAAGNYKVGSYNVEVNAVAHMTCDSLGNYRRTGLCNGTCDAINDNEVCATSLFDPEWHGGGPTFEFECADIAKNTTKVEGGEVRMIKDKMKKEPGTTILTFAVRFARRKRLPCTCPLAPLSFPAQTATLQTLGASLDLTRSSFQTRTK